MSPEISLSTSSNVFCDRIYLKKWKCSFILLKAMLNLEKYSNAFFNGNGILLIAYFSNFSFSLVIKLSNVFKELNILTGVKYTKNIVRVELTT